jgi:putative ABC transport system permease protein
MFYLRLIWTAIRSLDANFLRSLLATLGVLIGVASVVACMSIMEGFSNRITRTFKSLGSNLLYVQPAPVIVDGRPRGSAQTLTTADAELLSKKLPELIDVIAPEALGSATIKRFQKSYTYPVISTSDTYFKIHDFNPTQGRVFSADEARDESSNLVCLGAKAAEELFGGMDAVGQVIKIGSTQYRVLGVMEKKGSLGFLDADSSVFIPFQIGLRRFLNRTYIDRMTIALHDSDHMEMAEREIKRVLRSAHGLRIGQDDDFRVQNQEQALADFNQIMMYFKVVFYSIAGISLVVGGIGIMNIMLVSVTERTREIGVRMAVGARRSDILLQFLVEGLIISLLGGAFGLLLGAMFADLLNNVIEGFFKTEINPKIVLTAVATSTIVGVFSGVYPAWKASRLDPVEALRYE